MEDAAMFSASSEDSPPKAHRKKRRKSFVDGLHGLLKKRSHKKSSKDTSCGTSHDDSESESGLSTSRPGNQDYSEFDLTYDTSSDFEGSAVSSVVSEPISSPEARRIKTSSTPIKDTDTFPRSPTEREHVHDVQKIWDLDVPSFEITTCCQESWRENVANDVNGVTQREEKMSGERRGQPTLELPEVDQRIMIKMPPRRKCDEKSSNQASDKIDGALTKDVERKADAQGGGDESSQIVDKIEVDFSWFGYGVSVEVTNLQSLPVEIPKGENVTATDVARGVAQIIGGWASTLRKFSRI